MDIKNFSRKKIADGVHFSCYNDSRFQKNRIEICFSDILDRKNASHDALIPAILSRSNNKYKTMQELNNRLSELYASGINDFVENSGDIHEFGLYSYSLCNEYAFDGENVLEVIVTSNLAHKRRDDLSCFLQIPPSGIMGDVSLCRYEK